MTETFSTRALRALVLLCLLLSPVTTPDVARAMPSRLDSAVSTAANPWATVAPALFRSESPFDQMDAVTLASLPAGKRIHWNAPATCVPATLKAVLEEVAKRYGPVTVNSTVRSKARNARVGGRPKSMHLHCRAIDFRVHGKTSGLLKWLAGHKGVGGYKRYKSGFYHIDNGAKRTW